MKSFDDKEPSKYIMYLDANNLYDQAMRQYLRYSKFKWLNQNEIDKFCLNSIGENSLVGSILEVDLDYIDEFHELHNEYPLVPETFEISRQIITVALKKHLT